MVKNFHKLPEKKDRMREAISKAKRVRVVWRAQNTEHSDHLYKIEFILNLANNRRVFAIGTKKRCVLSMWNISSRSIIS